MLYINIIIYLLIVLNDFSNAFSFINPLKTRIFTGEDKNRYNPFSKKYYKELANRKQNETRNNNNNNNNNKMTIIPKKYSLTRPSYIEEIKRLNSKNRTIQNNSILDNDNDNDINDSEIEEDVPKLRIFLPKSSFLKSLGIELEDDHDNKQEND